MNVQRTPKKIPDFNYLSNHQHEHFRCIVYDGVVMHRISNFDEFFKALGYSEDINATGVLPDEFVWDRYFRDNAAKSRQCLQTLITSYLYNHSERFRDEFGSEYADMLGKCISDKIDGSDHCVNCPMHPRFLY